MYSDKRKSCYDCCFLEYAEENFWCCNGSPRAERFLGWSVNIPSWCPRKETGCLSITKKEFIDKAKTMKKPIISKECQDNGVYEKVCWLIKDDCDPEKKFHTPSVRINNWYYTQDSFESFEERKRKAEKKYKRWLIEAMIKGATERKSILLTAVYDILKKQEQSFYVLNFFEQLTVYDGVECDGRCLMNDIAIELGIKEG